MVQQASSWWYETAILTIRYILVGIAFIPSGLAYAVWTNAHGASPVAMSLFLLVGSVLPIAVWQLSAQKLVMFESERVPSANLMPTISDAMLAALAGPAAEHWSMSKGPQIVEQQLFVRLLAHPELARQLVDIRNSQTVFDQQRIRHAIDFAQGAGSQHAAFSSASS